MRFLATKPLGYKLGWIIALKLLFLVALYQFVIRPQLFHADAQATANHLIGSNDPAKRN